MSDRHVIGSDSKSMFGNKTVATLVLGLLFMPFLSLIIPANAAMTYDLDQSEFQLLITPSAPNLPADRNSYYAMIQLMIVDNENPIEAPTDMAIRIISSDPSVLFFPQSSVVLMQGQSIVKVELVTTDKSGVASITAQSEGVGSSTASVTTYRMDSLEPTRLAIYAAPSSFIPDSQTAGMIYIQILNSQSLPAVSKNDISVDISSSDTTVGRVPSYAVIPAGSSGILVDFTPQNQIGHTIIKASAPGLAPGELLVSVDGPVASKLSVEFAPNVVPAVNYNDALMTVQLTDDNDEPVKASKLTKIFLKSSDTSVIEVPQYVEISSGKSYASAFVVAKGKVGNATITASATGYGTGINTIKAVDTSQVGANDPKKLELFAAPSRLPPDNSEHKSLVVAFQDLSGKPYRQISYYFQRIALSTSNIQVGDITSTSFVAKETYAIANFKTKYAVGDTQITASLEGYQPTQMTLTIAGSGPAMVELNQIPKIIEADNFDSNSLVVSLVDHNGMPITAQEDTVVFLSSSNPEVARVQGSATIPSGKSHVSTPVQTTLRAGISTLTGAADGLGAGSMVFHTVGFTGSISEFHLGLYVIPNLPADGKEYEAVVVQLQDQSGLPVLAKSDVTVSLSSGSLGAGTVQDSVVIPEGSGMVTALFKTTLKDSDLFKITASSEGFESVEAEMKTSVQPLAIFRSVVFPTNSDFGDEIPVAVDVFSGAIPVRNAVVTVTGASTQDTNSLTDENGHAEGVYIPTLPGSNTIVVKVNKPGYQEAELSSRIVLEHLVDVTINAETQGGISVPTLMEVSVPRGVSSKSASSASPIIFENVNWGSYKVSAPPQVTTSDAVYDFARWSDGSTENPRTWNVVEDTKISAIYDARYLLQINDVNGLAAGLGYYAEGESATIAMSATVIPGFLVDKEFAGWNGAIKSTSPSTEVVMDGPKIIDVEWRDNYLKVGLIAAAIGGGGFIYYWKIFKPKRDLEVKERAPDLDWYKS